MFRRLSVLVTLITLAGCAGASLPYKPEKQPSGGRVSAAYHVAGDKLKIEIDSGQRRVEEAAIVKGDGIALRAQAIEIAPPITTSSPIMIGVGGGTYSGRVGTGVSVSAPVGSTTSRIEGNTYAVFPAAEAGSPPWQLRVKVSGLEPVMITVGDPRR